MTDGIVRIREDERTLEYSFASEFFFTIPDAGGYGNEMEKQSESSIYRNAGCTFHDINDGQYPASFRAGIPYACGNRKDSHQPGGQSLKLLVTVSGLLIDENQQVLDHDFEPISGLYATGNCSGCRFGFQYTTSLPGQSISIAQTLGRILGSRLAGKEIS